ncbi:MAG: DNA polymerase III subunit delta' C-terminal domain-containing protein, partial [Gammaproteobacteria bacterium]
GSYLVDALRMQQGDRESIKNIDLIDVLQVIADSLPAAALHHMVARTWQNQRLARQAGVNRQLLLEELLIDWSRAGAVRRVRA